MTLPADLFRRVCPLHALFSQVILANEYDGPDAGASAGKLTKQTSYAFGPVPLFSIAHRLVSTKKFGYGDANGSDECDLSGQPRDDGTPA